jgi:hypothetical protein
LINDKGTIYTIEQGLKRPIASMEVFNGLGYSMDNVITADTSETLLGDGIFDASGRHSRGTLVKENSTVYFMGKDMRYAFPSIQVFLSWGASFKEIVAANPSDLSVALGPNVSQGQVLGTSITAIQEGSLIKGNAETVFLVTADNKLKPFVSRESFWSLGYDFIQVTTVPDQQIYAREIIAPF